MSAKRKCIVCKIKIKQKHHLIFCNCCIKSAHRRCLKKSPRSTNSLPYTCYVCISRNIMKLLKNGTSKNNISSKKKMIHPRKRTTLGKLLLKRSREPGAFVSDSYKSLKNMFDGYDSDALYIDQSIPSTERPCDPRLHKENGPNSDTMKVSKTRSNRHRIFCDRCGLITGTSQTEYILDQRLLPYICSACRVKKSNIPSTDMISSNSKPHELNFKTTSDSVDKETEVCRAANTESDHNNDTMTCYKESSYSGENEIDFSPHDLPAMLLRLQPTLCYQYRPNVSPIDRSIQDNFRLS